MTASDLTITRCGSERLDDLQPLWESLHHHHAAVAPELRALGVLRAPEDSWGVRRDLYLGLLAEPDAFVLIAEVGSTPVGYSLVHLRGPEETWSTGDRVAELETLALLPGHRGESIGSTLVEAVFSELKSLGVAHFSVGVIASNARAIRFYERLGLLPFIVSYIGNVPAADAGPGG